MVVSALWCLLSPKRKKKQQLCTRGQVKMYPMSNKGVCCTSTCWDKNNELHLEWFRAIVFNLHCLQSQKRKKKTAILCPGASQNVPNEQIRCPLHIYMLRRIQWTWFGVIWSGSFRSTLFTKSKTQKNSNFGPVGKSKCTQWANKVYVAHLRVETNAKN